MYRYRNNPPASPKPARDTLEARLPELFAKVVALKPGEQLLLKPAEVFVVLGGRYRLAAKARRKRCRAGTSRLPVQTRWDVEVI
jgi:hypothetical protein